MQGSFQKRLVRMGSKVFFIVNPVSRGGKSLYTWHEVYSLLKLTNLDVSYGFTQAVGEATKLAKEAALLNVYDIIVSFGGDGTANEIINGLIDATNQVEIPTFTIFPAGTGSDTVRTLGITSNFQDFFNLLEKNISTKIDVGVVNYQLIDETTKRCRYFINACDIGIGATVVNTVNQMNKDDVKKSGKAKYFRSIITQVLKFKAFNASVKINETHFPLADTVIIAICNGRFFGGGVKVSPLSKMNDGCLEMVSTTGATKMDLFNIVSKIYHGSHVDHKKVRFESNRNFCVALEKPQLLETDGEVVGLVLEAEFKVASVSINVLC